MHNTMQFLILDDHPIFSLGLSSALSGVYPNAQIYCCENVNEAEAKLSTDLDVMFVDHTLDSARTGMNYAASVAKRYSSIKIVLITADLSHEMVHRARFAGLHGAISKHQPSDKIAHMCQTILNGGRYFDRHGVKEVLSSASHVASDNSFALTSKEIAVLDHLKSGELNKQLASRLNITENTLRAHLRNIFRKMKVSNRTECVTKAIGNGIV